MFVINSNNYKVKIEKYTENIDGTVEVRENNEIVVKDPVGLGDYPTITPCEGVEVYVNGIIVENTIVVSEKDIIEVIPFECKRTFDFTVNIAKDKMKALLSFRKNPSSTYKIIPQEPARHIQLKAKLLEQCKNRDGKRCAEELFKEILIKLNELGINYGINYENIKNLVHKKEVVDEVIVEGREGLVGKNAEIKYLFQENLTITNNNILI